MKEKERRKKQCKYSILYSHTIIPVRHQYNLYVYKLYMRTLRLLLEIFICILHNVCSFHFVCPIPTISSQCISLDDTLKFWLIMSFFCWKCSQCVLPYLKAMLSSSLWQSKYIPQGLLHTSYEDTSTSFRDFLWKFYLHLGLDFGVTVASLDSL